jgi:hypothetical protein
MDADTLAVLRIQPLLKEKCLACHGDDQDKIKADYDMRSVEGLFKGGESGVPAIVPSQPDQSPLYLSVLRTHDDWDAMPPKDNDALSSEQTSWIKSWITGGAPWPNDARKAEITKTADKAWIVFDDAKSPARITNDIRAVEKCNVIGFDEFVIANTIAKTTEGSGNLCINKIFGGFSVEMNENLDILPCRVENFGECGIVE